MKMELGSEPITVPSSTPIPFTWDRFSRCVRLKGDEVFGPNWDGTNWARFRVEAQTDIGNYAIWQEDSGYIVYEECTGRIRIGFQYQVDAAKQAEKWYRETRAQKLGIPLEPPPKDSIPDLLKIGVMVKTRNEKKFGPIQVNEEHPDFPYIFKDSIYGTLRWNRLGNYLSGWRGSNRPEHHLDIVKVLIPCLNDNEAL